jgi:DNA-binding MarR family transcriptional regulator
MPDPGSTARRRARAQASPAEDGANLTQELEESAGYLLRQAQLAVFTDFVRHQSGPVTTPGQFGLLLVIGKHPGRTQSELGDALGIRRTNLVPVLDQFETLGLVRRAPCLRDRRANRLYLTRAGEAILKRATAAHQKHESRITDLLGETGRRKLMELLNKLRAIGQA